MTTDIGGYTAVINEADRACKAIASYSAVLFRLSQNDSADAVCTKLTLAAAALKTDDIPDLNGAGKLLFLRAAAARMQAVSEEIAALRTELSGSMTELYKLRELLVTLRDCSGKDSDILSGCTERLRDICSTDISQSEKALISHMIKDAVLSQTVAQKNISIAESWLIKTDSLVSGLTSFETHLIPLWQTRYADAGASCKAEDMTACIAAGNLFADKIAEIVKAITG